MGKTLDQEENVSEASDRLSPKFENRTKMKGKTSETNGSFPLRVRALGNGK